MKKLIAVGTTDPNPLNWEPWNEVKLYIADSVEEAIGLDDRYRKGPAVEVDMTKSQFVLGMSEFPDD